MMGNPQFGPGEEGETFAQPPITSSTRNFWREFSCAIGCLIAAGDQADEKKWAAAEAAYGNLSLHILERGVAISLHERVLVEAYSSVRGLGFQWPEARAFLLAAMRLFTAARTRRAPPQSPEAQSNYWWVDA